MTRIRQSYTCRIRVVYESYTSTATAGEEWQRSIPGALARSLARSLSLPPARSLRARQWMPKEGEKRAPMDQFVFGFFVTWPVNTIPNES